MLQLYIELLLQRVERRSEFAIHWQYFVWLMYIWIRVKTWPLLVTIKKGKNKIIHSEEGLCSVFILYYLSPAVSKKMKGKIALKKLHQNVLCSLWFRIALALYPRSQKKWTKKNKFIVVSEIYFFRAVSRMLSVEYFFLLAFNQTETLCI